MSLPEWWPSDKPYIIGDCLEGMKPLPDKCINLLIPDPPYNEDKAEWDSIDNYLEWWEKCVIEFARILKDNGVLYFFQMNIETAMDMHRICKKHGFIIRQMITIYKGLASVAGRTSEDLRSFPKATEYLFYYTFQDETGLKLIEKDIKLYKNLREYCLGLREYIGYTRQKMIVNLGNGRAQHFLEPLGPQWQLCTLETYQDLIDVFYINKWEGFREYEDLRKEYEDLRYTFNLPYGVTDVWQFDFYKDKVAEHETPKPIKLIQRIIAASSNTGDIILDPFLGSGTTLLACRKTNRIGLGFEINPDYEPIIRRRSLQDIKPLEGYF